MTIDEIFQIRKTIPKDDTDLRASLEAHGWDKRFPGYKDENGIILVGNRRNAICEQIGRAPYFITLELGSGEQADIERVKLAFISNVGGASLTKADRTRIEEHLYTNRKWTMEAIGKALGVSHKTVSIDLQGICTIGTNQKHGKTPTNPKGSGRPKGRKTDDVAEKQKRAVELSDAGLTPNQIRDELGYKATRTVNQILERENIRREARADPDIDPESLSLSARQKFDSAIRKYKRQLDAEFAERVRREVTKKMEDFYIPDMNKQLAEVDEIRKYRKGVFKLKDYKLIKAGLHPDRGLSDKRQNEAFTTFTAKELQLVSEEEMPTQKLQFPDTLEEWERQKQKQQAARRAKRGQPVRV